MQYISKLNNIFNETISYDNLRELGGTSRNMKNGVSLTHDIYYKFKHCELNSLICHQNQFH